MRGNESSKNKIDQDTLQFVHQHIQSLLPIKQAKCREVLCENYSFSFFKPKKDQCSLCERYNRATETGSIDDELKTEYNEHQSMKVKSREEKEKDKNKSKEDSRYYTAKHLT